MIDPSEIPTPCFVLEEALLKRNLEILKMVRHKSEAKIICALKAFSMYSSFPLANQYLNGTTASSLHEARLGYEEFGSEVHAYSPAYLPDEFNEILSYCNHITFNSHQQWAFFKSKVQENGSVSPGLRINPEYSKVDVDLYNPAAPGSRLGIAPDLLQELPAGIKGLHFHTLFESSAEELEKTYLAVEKHFGHLFPSLEWLNMGGGHAISKSDYNLDLLISLLKSIKEKYPNLEIILEPGSAVAWETGYLVSSVLDIVNNRGRQTAILDTSFAAHMPDCIEMPYKPKVRNARDSIPGDNFVYTLGGLTCLAGDFIEGYTFEKPLQIGDKITFLDMMHYTMVKTTTFNGVKHPNLGIWKENNEFTITKTFGYEDFKMRL